MLDSRHMVSCSGINGIVTWNFSSLGFPVRLKPAQFCSRSQCERILRPREFRSLAFMGRVRRDYLVPKRPTAADNKFLPPVGGQRSMTQYIPWYPLLTKLWLTFNMPFTWHNHGLVFVYVTPFPSCDDSNWLLEARVYRERILVV